MNPAIGKRLVLVSPPHVHEDFIEAAILDRRDDLRSDRLRVADAFRIDIDQKHVVSRCHFRDDPGLAFLELRRASGAQFPEKSGNGGERRNAWAIRPMDSERDQPDRQEPDDAARDREQPAHTSLVECDATLGSRSEVGGKQSAAKVAEDPAPLTAYGIPSTAYC